MQGYRAQLKCSGEGTTGLTAGLPNDVASSSQLLDSRSSVLIG